MSLWKVSSGLIEQSKRDLLRLDKPRHHLSVRLFRKGRQKGRQKPIFKLSAWFVPFWLQIVNVRRVVRRDSKIKTSLSLTDKNPIFNGMGAIASSNNGVTFTLSWMDWQFLFWSVVFNDLARGLLFKEHEYIQVFHLSKISLLSHDQTVLHEWGGPWQIVSVDTKAMSTWIATCFQKMFSL